MTKSKWGWLLAALLALLILLAFVARSMFGSMQDEFDSVQADMAPEPPLAEEVTGEATDDTSLLMEQEQLADEYDMSAPVKPTNSADTGGAASTDQ